MAFEFDNNVKDAIKIRQKGVCAHCGKSEIAQIHHVVPRQSGNPANPGHAWLATELNGVGLCKIDHQVMHIGEDAEYKVRYATAAVPPASYFKFAHGKAPKNDAEAQARWVRRHRDKARLVWGDLEERYAKKLASENAAIEAALLAEAANNADNIRRQIELVKGDHQAQMQLITKVDTSSLKGLLDTATGMLGYATSEFFNKIPPMTIWTKAENALSAARIAIQDKRLIDAAAHLTDARFNMMLAVARVTRWKDALYGTKESMGAGSKMMIAIGVSALLVVAVTFGAMAAAPAVISFFQGLGQVASASTPIVRLAATVTAAEQKFRIAEIAIEELEREVLAIEEATRAMRQ